MKKMQPTLSYPLGGGALFCVLLFGSFYSADARTSQSATPGMHRILVKVFDAETSQPLAARVSFTDGQGEYYPPYGHPRKIPSGPWGGDLALPDGKNYAYVDKIFETELPSSLIRVEASRGFEYDVFERS